MNNGSLMLKDVGLQKTSSGQSLVWIFKQLSDPKVPEADQQKPTLERSLRT